jgi:iron complex transport system ATP-binding protein
VCASNATFHSATERGVSFATQTHLYMHPAVSVINAIEVRNLSFAYSGRLVLEGINFQVERGVICGLLGPNGSGKTTLLKCINGLRAPLDGQVMIEGVPVDSMTRQRISSKVSVVPQQANIVFQFKAIELVVMGKCPELEHWQSPQEADYARAEKLMEGLGIGQLAYRRITEISGGERQLVLIARAIFQGADIMLLDEPTAHLDYRNQFAILNLVTEVAREKGLTVIITLHNPNLALHYCNKIVLLKEGRIVSIGSASAVFQEQTLSELYDMDISIADVTERDCQVVLPSDW